MRRPRLLSGRDDGDVAGIAVDAAMGVLAGLALILSVWLLTDAFRPDATPAANRTAAASLIES